VVGITLLVDGISDELLLVLVLVIVIVEGIITVLVVGVGTGVVVERLVKVVESTALDSPLELVERVTF
jgi:hypothetical protein